MNKANNEKILHDLPTLIYQRRGGRLGMTLREAAIDSDIPNQTLSRLERGGNPDIVTFRKLCLWLGVSADQLLGLKEKETK